MKPTFKGVLTVVYTLFWIVLALHPSDRAAWLLENLLLFLSLPLILVLERRYSFSTLSAVMIFLFAVVHTIGAHYTYAQTPLLQPIVDFFGFGRNPYDRIVHFLFGALVFWPVAEVLAKTDLSPRLSRLLAMLILIGCSSLYEIAEWLVAATFYPQLGTAFLGTQGDVWDTQKDHAMGVLGAWGSYLLASRRR